MPARPNWRLRTLVLGIATAALLTGCGTGAGTGASSPAPVAAAPTSATDGPTARPSPARTAPEVPVSGSDLASLAARTPPEPTSLAIGSLKVSLPVEPVGVQADGQMEIPPLAERAGWYRFGAAPGQDEGTAVIAAHVDSVASAGLGPFARLGELRPGDQVTVGLADGGVATYVVIDVRRIAKDEVTWEDVFVRDGGHRLVLITCGGTFQPQVRSYSDNVIVTAEPVGA